MHRVTLIKGDGIGPEVVASVIRVVRASGVEVIWEEARAGMAEFERTGNPLPKETLDLIRKNRIALKGPCDTPLGSGFASVNVALRKEFDLYANIRPVESFVGVKSRYQDVNLVVVREGVEDIYGGDEVYLDEDGSIADHQTDTVQVRGIFTAKNCRRFFRQVFDYAIKNRRKKVTIVHKANILKLSHGMFLRIGYEVAEQYKDIYVNDIAADDKIVDNTAQKLVLDPTQFDVIATSNMFGDILSDLCAGLVGGLGLAPGANLGDRCAIFEAVHGTAPDIAGKNLANPMAIILSAKMMLEYLGEFNAAGRIRRVAIKVLAEGKHTTKDLNPISGVSTVDMTDAIVEELERRA